MIDSEFDDLARTTTDPAALAAAVDALGPAGVTRGLWRWRDRGEKLLGYERLTGPQNAEGCTAVRVIDALVAGQERDRGRQRDHIRSVVAGGGHLEHGMPGDNAAGPQLLTRTDPWATPPTAAGAATDVRGQARTAVERCAGVPDGARQAMTVALEADRGESLTRLARWTVATSDPAYTRAFWKLAADPQGGHREFDADELRAFRHAQSEARALSLTDANGGYLVPFQLDPTVILANDGAHNPLRQIARTVIATGDVWHGVSSSGVTSSWVGEGQEAGDDSPTFAQPTVPVHKSMSFVPVSYEALDDMAGGAQEIARLLADAADRQEAEAFITGSGAGQPTGIVTALTGTASVVEQSGATLDADDWRAVQNALPPRWQANAAWIAALPTMNVARATPIGTGLDTPVLTEGNPPTVLGKPIWEANYLDDAITEDASDRLTVYGDWTNYVIADRIGTSVELVPNLFGPNRRPTGQRGWLMWRRVGANSVNDAAFRMLDKNA